MSKSQIWTEQLIAHLELAKQVASKLPAGETLDAQELNKVLDLLGEINYTFLLQCQMQGFKTKVE